MCQIIGITERGVRKMRDKWPSRFTFILASIGSAVGLGNAWRFPGLAAKHGGGAFLFAYIIAMIAIGMPLLMMELSIGRKMKAGSPVALKGLRKGGEYIGWAATANAFVIVTYYAAVFAWVILMALLSFKFASMTGTSTGIEQAENLWANSINTTWGTSLFGQGSQIPLLLLISLAIAWFAIYYCIKDGASSVSKVVKYTVFIPVVLLVILALRGFTMGNTGAAMKALFVPKFEAFKEPTIWVDAIGQAFYSLSIMMAIMIAYGSFLDDKSNIVEDVMIIAVSDFLTSVLSGIVLFTTMYGCGMTVDDMSASGISTAFLIYPMAIVQLTNVGWINAVFGFIFYLMLITLTIDSAFSIVEGISASISDKYGISKKKTTVGIILVAAVISLIYVTGSGVAWLDIVDNWTNQYNLLIVGVLECVLVGWFFKPKKVLKEINKNTNKLKMPAFWFYAAVMVIAPLALLGLTVWNIYILIAQNDGLYGGYPLYANIVGWIITFLAFMSGFIVKLITKFNPRLRALAWHAEQKFKTWEQLDEEEAEAKAQQADTPVEIVEESVKADGVLLDTAVMQDAVTEQEVVKPKTRNTKKAVSEKADK